MLKTFITISLIFGITLCFSQADDSYQEYVAAQNCFNTSDGVIRYLDQGEGDPIVLLHGVPTSGWMFREMVPQLVADGYRVIVPDMLGFGNSDNPEGIDLYTPENHAKRLNELMQSLSINEWTQVAHGAGSLWTYEAIKKSPNQIQNLILLNAYVSPHQINMKEQLQIGIFAKLRLWLNKIGVCNKTFMNHFLKDRTVFGNLTKNMLKGYAVPIENGKLNATFAHYQFIENALRFHKQSWLPDFKGEKAFIWGESDNYLSWENTKAALSLERDWVVQDSNVFLLAADHLLTEDSPGVVSDYIHQFLTLNVK